MSIYKKQFKIKNDIWKQNFSHIFISVKFFGIWFEMCSEPYTFGDEADAFIQRIKQKYKEKFPNRAIKFRFYYPSSEYIIQD